MGIALTKRSEETAETAEIAESKSLCVLGARCGFFLSCIQDLVEAETKLSGDPVRDRRVIVGEVRWEVADDGRGPRGCSRDQFFVVADHHVDRMMSLPVGVSRPAE